MYAFILVKWLVHYCVIRFYSPYLLQLSLGYADTVSVEDGQIKLVEELDLLQKLT